MNTFAALADPIRLEIVEMLAGQELPAGEIASRFAVSRPAVSRHLRTLREAGLLDAHERAQQRVYRLNHAPLVELDEWLSRYRRFWSTKLDALAQHLEGGQ